MENLDGEINEEKIMKEMIREMIGYCTIVSTNKESKNVTQKEADKFWSEAFHKMWMKNNNWTKIIEDDCLYYVKKSTNLSSSKKKTLTNSETSCFEEKFFVRRADTKGHPDKSDISIEWESTMLLNIILHHFKYIVEVSVRIRENSDPGKLSVIKKVSKKVYAIPSKIRMDDKTKAEEVEFTYPYIYFSIGDFDEAWKDIMLTKEGEVVCVELFALGNYFESAFDSSFKSTTKTRLFAGALDYNIINHEYKSKTGIWTSGTKQFFSLQGPGGKGGAEMAVQPQAEKTSSESNSVYSITMTKISSPFKWFSTSSNPLLNCSLTSLSLRWDIIIKDLLETVNKKIKK